MSQGKKHQPTEETRKQVKAAAGFGLRHEKIAILLGITDKTLRRRYRKELDEGSAQAQYNVAGKTYEMAMKGYVIEASSLEELEIPEDVLRQPVLALDIGVTHHKARGAAWAQYTILVVSAEFDTNRA